MHSVKNSHQSELSKNVISEFIRAKYLEKKGWTQQDLAEKLNVTRGTISHLLTGRRELSASMIMLLGQELEEPSSFWMELKNIPNDLEDIDEFIKQKLNNAKDARSVDNQILVDYEINNLIFENPKFIESFESSNMRPVSYYLRIGKEIIVSVDRADKLFDLENEKSIELLPASRAVVTTFETLDFPKDYFGRLGVITDITSAGLYVAHGSIVDPGFRGKLYFSIINLSHANVPIEYKQDIMSLEINKLSRRPEKEYKGKNLMRKEFLPSEKRFVGIDASNSLVNQDRVKNFVSRLMTHQID